MWWGPQLLLKAASTQQKTKSVKGKAFFSFFFSIVAEDFF